MAEVLITLGIIGVVAALTMPSLIQNYRKHVVVNKLKTDMSLMQNALNMAVAKHGPFGEWSLPSNCFIVSDTDAVCAEYVFETYIAPELQVIEKCYPASEKCWTEPKSLDGTKGYLHLNSTSPAVVLKNGTSLFFWVGGRISDNNAHIQVWFDIDGPYKGKNTIGADVFGLYINFSSSKTHLVGSQIELENILKDPAHGCSKDSTGLWAGRYCAGLIEYNGWQIPDDYPIKF